MEVRFGVVRHGSGENRGGVFTFGEDGIDRRCSPEFGNSHFASSRRLALVRQGFQAASTAAGEASQVNTT